MSGRPRTRRGGGRFVVPLHVLAPPSRFVRESPDQRSPDHSRPGDIAVLRRGGACRRGGSATAATEWPKEQ